VPRDDAAQREPTRWKAFLASKRTLLLAVGLAILLNLPALPTGWYVDDLLHRALFLEIHPMMDSVDMTNRMFDFLSGDPEEVSAYKDVGVIPWWTEDQLKIRFWRPLSSFTHVVDYTLFPNSGLGMHAHSMAWLVVLVVSTALLYRRLFGASIVAGLATLLYALDDAHGMPVAFLANRNALIAASFGVMSLWAHARYRRDGFRPGAVLSPLAFGAALLGGESGLGVAPYLLGYALFLERNSLLARLATIAPHGLIGMAWLLAYRIGGYGTDGSGFYLDPLGQPSAWLSEFPIRASLLLLGQWFVPPSSFTFAWTPAQALGIAVFGVLFIAFLFLWLSPILRDDATARFLTFGMMGSVVPITAGFPHDRLLFFVGIGGMGLLALLLVRLFDRSTATFAGRVFGSALIFVHVVVAAPMQLIMNAGISTLEPLYANAPRSLPDDPSLASQRLVVVNPSNEFYGQYTLIVRLFDGKPAPESLLMLAPGTSSLVIERVGARELTVEASNGWMSSPFDNVYRGADRIVPENYRVSLTGVSIRVVSALPDGRPNKVAFTFDDELEHPSLRWVRFEDSRYVPFDLPAIGESVSLPAVPFDMFTPPPPIAMEETSG
jgi:hypothetical protein